MKLRKQAGVLLALCALMPVGIVAQPHTAYATTLSTVQATKCRQPSAASLSGAEMTVTTAGAPIDGICFIVGICTGVWPIGTLICGPTAIGCVIHYWKL